MKILVLLISVIITVVALIYFSLPFVWIALCWFLCFIYLTFTAKTSTPKVIWFNLAFLCATFGLFEWYSWSSMSKPTQEPTQGLRQEYQGKGYYRNDDILGYAPTQGKSVNAIEYWGNDLIYNVTYTIGDNGLRISPPEESNNQTQCAVFFGDSFTFGEGVQDNETMPYQVSKLSNDKVYNFGFHGYGPHQMLSALEHGLVEKTVACKPSVGIYQALIIHTARSAGLSPWDKHGPKYISSTDGLKYDGHFDDHTPSAQIKDMSSLAAFVKTIAQEQIEKSFITKKYFPYNHYIVRDEDIGLFLEVIEASRYKFSSLYPGSAFHVILWDENPSDPQYIRIHEGLLKKGFNIHLASNILPHYTDQRSSYEISPYDRHPNPLAYTHIAQYVVKTILGK